MGGRMNFHHGGFAINGATLSGLDIETKHLFYFLLSKWKNVS